MSPREPQWRRRRRSLRRDDAIRPAATFACLGLALASLVSPGMAQEPFPTASSPSDDCSARGLYFDTSLQRCMGCERLDANSEPLALVAGPALRDAVAAGAVGQCSCAKGLVQCLSGETCELGGASSFVAERPLECKACPEVNGRQTAPSRDRRRCIPCSEKATDGAVATLGYSDEWRDCLCPAGHVLVEQSASGADLPEKLCTRCADGAFPGPPNATGAYYACGACPDPWRMARNAETGECECRSGTGASTSFIPAGGACIPVSEHSLVDEKFSETAAMMVNFRDLIDGRESWFQYSPFGHDLGIQAPGKNTMDALRMDDRTRVDTATVPSSTMSWLYMRCAVECHMGNETACHCISNLCVLLLYDDSATICRFLTNFLYEGREAVHLSDVGQGLQGMPWLLYAGARADTILNDASLGWKFTFSDDVGGVRNVANTLHFWLAKYSLEGSWLGWEKLSEQLDLCASLGGTSESPQSPPHAWRRFASSLVSRCKVSLESIMECGTRPVLYDLFVENVDGTLVPVPVRILNLVRNGARPNLNFARNVWRVSDELGDDVLVRRFAICDSASGRAGSSQAFLDPVNHRPQIFRWAAHMAIEVRIRPDSEAQIYVPVLSIAYVEKRTAALAEGESVWVTFKAEYSMLSDTYWRVIVSLLVITILAIFVIAGILMYLADRRYPNTPWAVPGVDPGLFVPKLAVQARVFLTTMLSCLFWFHYAVTLYWLVIFKLQSVPHVLLPSAFEAEQYKPHDVLLVLCFVFAVFCVALDVYRHLRIFVFLVDWERGAPVSVHDLPSAGNFGGQVGPGQQSQYQQQNRQFQTQPMGHAPHVGGPNMVGAPLLSSPSVAGLQFGASSFSGYSAHSQQQQQQPHEGTVMAPDSGVSAWRTLFICNQLNERLASTRAVPHITWLTMAALLEGLQWKNVARWYPRTAGEEEMLSAQLNPFLQFSLAVSVWLFVFISQLVVQRVASIRFGDNCHDFVDVCSVSNVSVLFLDEPYHGYYIHGKAPSNRGDWCHTELAKVLNNELKGIGLSRGLTPDGCQTFEVFLPPDLAVKTPGGGPAAHFRQTLGREFTEVSTLRMLIANRRPEPPTPVEVAQMSHHRCVVQSLIDTTIHAALRGAGEIVRERETTWFWGAMPRGGVMALQQPLFLKDHSGLAWRKCLAFGSGLRICWVDFPTGFEWRLGLLELLTFQLLWRFQGSIFLGTTFAFLANQAVLRIYAYFGRLRLSQTTLINPMFLLGRAPRAQTLVYGVVALAFFIYQVS